MEAINSVRSVEIEVTVVLGRTTMPIHQLLRLGRGAVIELDTTENDKVEVLANEKLIAKADVVVHADQIGVQISEKL